MSGRRKDSRRDKSLGDEERYTWRALLSQPDTLNAMSLIEWETIVLYRVSALRMDVIAEIQDRTFYMVRLVLKRCMNKLRKAYADYPEALKFLNGGRNESL